MSNEQRSSVQIGLISGEAIDFEMSASPGVVPTLLKEMKNTGMLTLWNEDETLCVMANQIRSISVIPI